MPLIHISLRRGKPAAYRKALFDSIHEAMHEMTLDPQGQMLLAGIGFKGFEPAKSSDWNDIRQLHISPADARSDPAEAVTQFQSP